MQLTQDQIDQFEQDGVIIARGVLTDADLQPVIDELAAWIDVQARTLQAEGKIPGSTRGRWV